MSISEPLAVTIDTKQSQTTAPKPARRPLRKQAMHWVRRGHLYMGLFLFPWAILYGITAFLFNHPTAFSDQPSVSFDRSVLAGTPLESLSTPMEQAEAVVAMLNEIQKPAVPYVLAGEAKFARDFATASVKADGQTTSVFLDVKTGGGTIRTTPTRERKVLEKAPFATGGAGPGGRSGRGPAGPAGRSGPPRGEITTAGGAVKLDNSLPERIKAAVPTILERSGFAAGEVTVTAVPDIVFPVEAGSKTWTATYSPLTGSVSGTPANDKPETELGWRRFLLRLHTAHGYPVEANSKWFWALIVDAMAFTMCFWGLSGLIMWWQIKATRRAGAIVLVLSAITATVLGFAMHAAMTG